ncbi:MAG: protease modulator HflC [Verrucomicrobia bacterium]|nr:protease modulator HflC [Verrucomicrobiota bacterium]MCF7708735.1 protease modulator HflC [Verrucomicrobiota bacterium]
MKRDYLTMLTGAVLAVIFFLMLFTFQVRKTEYAVVTTFGRYTRGITNAGFNWRLPWPIQSIYRFDNRIRNFERKFEQTMTKDGRTILLTTFIGWRITNPRLFLERFAGEDVTQAEEVLGGMVGDAKNSVIGGHPFRDLISTNRQELKFDVIENEMLEKIKPTARENYGIDIAFLGLKRLGLPESITTRVFERMRAERQREVTMYRSEGEREATSIRAEADRRRQEILAKAEAEATVIRGEGDAAAAKSYAVFEKNPDLAVFLLRLKSLESTLKNRTTLVLDRETTPFNMLIEQPETEIGVEKAVTENQSRE